MDDIVVSKDEVTKLLKGLNPSKALGPDKLHPRALKELATEFALCLSCICLLAMHTLICVTFSLPPGIRGWLRLLLVALPGSFCLPIS